MSVMQFFQSAGTITSTDNRPIFFTSAGQSNLNGNALSSNTTELAQLRPDLIGIINNDINIFGLSDEPKVYNVANEAIDVNWNYSGGQSTSVSLHPSMVNLLYGNFQRPIYIQKEGVDATKMFDRWKLGADLNVKWKGRIDDAVSWMDTNIGVNEWIFGGFIFFQGESDTSAQEQADYEGLEYAMINDLRSNYGSNTLYVSCGIKTNQPVDNAKILNANKDIRNFWFSNDDETLGDGIHYVTASEISIGEKVANIIIDNKNLII